MRISGSSGLVGVWNWDDVVTSKVTVVSSGTSTTAGTFTAVSANATWHGAWKEVAGSPDRARLLSLICP